MVKSGIAKFVQWLGYGLGNQGSSVRFPARAKHSSPKYSDCFSCPPSLLVNYYWGLFPNGQRALHLITHICYVLRLRMSGAISPSSICLHAIHTNNGLLFFWQRQMAIDREKACMYNCQSCVLGSVSSSSFHRRVKLLSEPWYPINFLCLLPLHVIWSTVLKKYNRQQ